MESSLRAGSAIAGRYRLVRLLGEGGMGTIWAADHLQTGLRFALKFAKRDALGTLDCGRKRRLLREAQAAAAVRHPNVVAIHEVLELDDGSPAIVMDLLSGESLAASLLRERVLDLAAAASILLPVVSAVGAAHALGIIHRDLNPSNIFLVEGADPGSRVKVLDFGIAKLVALGEMTARDTGLTTTGTLIGTPAYMAPEQLFGDEDLDHRVDVWGLGLIAYQCLSGILPTAGEHIGEVLKKVLSRPIAPLAEVALTLPHEVADLVDRMLSRRAADRPDLREVRELLARHALASTFERTGDSELVDRLDAEGVADVMGSR